MGHRVEGFARRTVVRFVTAVLSSVHGDSSGTQWFVVSRVLIRTTIKTGRQSGSVSRGGGW